MTASIDLLRPALLEGASQLGGPLTPAQADRFLAYLALLSRWNATYNLTAIRQPADMLVQHVLDCLAVIEPLRRHAAGRPMRLLDVGSGGGLPGIVIASVLPAFDVTCIDTVGKKAAFVQQAAGELRLDNLHSVHGRVETLQERPFDVVTSRAFAALADFVRLSRSALHAGGVWMAMKGKPPKEEWQALDPSVEMFHVEQLSVPGLNADRCLVWMRRMTESASSATEHSAP